MPSSSFSTNSILNQLFGTGLQGAALRTPGVSNSLLGNVDRTLKALGGWANPMLPFSRDDRSLLNNVLSGTRFAGSGLDSFSSNLSFDDLLNSFGSGSSSNTLGGTSASGGASSSDNKSGTIENQLAGLGEIFKGLKGSGDGFSKADLQDFADSAPEGSLGKLMAGTVLSSFDALAKAGGSTDGTVPLSLLQKIGKAMKSGGKTFGQVLGEIQKQSSSGRSADGSDGSSSGGASRGGSPTPTGPTQKYNLSQLGDLRGDLTNATDIASRNRWDKNNNGFFSKEEWDGILADKQLNASDDLLEKLKANWNDFVKVHKDWNGDQENLTEASEKDLEGVQIYLFNHVGSTVEDALKALMEERAKTEGGGGGEPDPTTGSTALAANSIANLTTEASDSKSIAITTPVDTTTIATSVGTVEPNFPQTGEPLDPVA